MKAFGVVYLVKNRTNGKCYVGQTTQEPETRFDQHRRRPGTSPLAGAIRLYGAEAFEYLVVCVASNQDALNEAEIAMISAYESTAPRGYNIKGGGSAGKHSAQTRAKISSAHRGKKLTATTIEKFRQRMLGTSPSPETRAKIAATLRGRPIAPDNFAKLIAANTGRVPSAASRLKMSQNRAGIPMAESTKEKLRAANLGKTHTAETRERMSASQRERWASRRS